MKNILHYGLQRSGTNFLENLLLKNFDVMIRNTKRKRNRPLNKHFRPYSEKHIIPEPKYKNELFFNSFQDFLKAIEHDFEVEGVVVVSKDPYSWLLSYQKWGKKHRWKKPGHHYIEEYNLFHKKWIEFAAQSEKILLIKYIDLLVNPANQLAAIQNVFDLNEKKTSDITKFRRVRNSGNFTDEKANYYIKQEYLNQYDDSVLQEINGLLDLSMMEKLGYDIAHTK